MQQLVKQLAGIAGKNNVLTARADLYCYGYDATFRRYVPDVVVKPQNTGQVAAIIKLAVEKGVPVYPRGAGTGLSGGSLPVRGGIVMAMTDMNSIHEIDRENLLAVVEPGVVTAHLHRAVEKEGLFYPPDPASSDVCTIGGNIAECAGGPRGFKYGVTRDYVLGLELVSPTGEILRTGGKTVKNVSGYDLSRLLVGSEGTLGIITGAILRLIPRPRAVKTLMAVYDNLQQAGESIISISTAGVIPGTMEIMDQLAIRCVAGHSGGDLPTNAAAILIIEVDGMEAAVQEEAAIVARVCQAAGARDVVVAERPADRDRLWRARRSVSAALVQFGPTKISEDATVPRSRIPDMITRLQQIREKYRLNLVIFGHAGDGNLHPNIVTNENNPEEMQRVEAAIEEIFRAAVSLGGTLSGEHGIGILKAPYMGLEFSPAELDYMEQIKKTLDPRGILNPGKIFEKRRHGQK